MILFDWLFHTGDTVTRKDGEEVRVVGFKPEGFVDVKVKDGKGGTKTVSDFGGNLKPKGGRG